MTDPAEIIAETILKPPPQDGHHDENFRWQYGTMMANSAAPELVSHIAAAAVKALTDAGWTLVPHPEPEEAPGVLPSPDQMRTWLICHEWKPADEGALTTLWYPPVRGRGVTVPNGNDGDPGLIMSAVEKIAGRMMMSADRVLGEMMLDD